MPDRYQDDAARLGRLRRDRQGVVLELLGQHHQWWRYFRLPDLWPLFRAIVRRDGGAGARLRARKALRGQPAALGGHSRLHPLLRPARRRPPDPPLAGRAARSPPHRAPHPRRPRRRRRLRRADGRARAQAEPEPRRPRDRLHRRRPAQARHAHGGPEGPRHDKRDRRRTRPPQPRRGRDRDPVGAGRPARQGRRRVPRARHRGADPADRVRAAARRRAAHTPAARGPGRGRARPRRRL